ncbi:helix-turn-helix domain-containing protein [Kineosporia sp. J2-2]|uniref:Helix-turn-helix domain-containing protein n=1 Tax=Kineosporia corallincola TaxID=2835133 RepID=A0ABS5TB62_9ACTN|nr:helix-turn-helix transcriptional regulator [Kineosporia corallincola]MBT0767684.1 helix-turn-helix domain-containing protein [Kineosporia corallincola]
MPRTELARFLRDRREALRPTDAGLPGGPRRRTPGLRREEVAELAGMSVDYYARLEQARGPRPSAAVLDAVCSALKLGPAERIHLFRLAGSAPTAPAGPARRVRPHVTGLLGRMPGTAAVVTAANYDVVAWNPLAEALLGPQAGRNLARSRFLTDDGAKTSTAPEFAEIVVTRLRAAAVRYPHDEALKTLLDDLFRGSEEFRGLWRANPVRLPGHQVKTPEHPRLGRLRLNCDVLAVPEDDQQVVFITADPGSPSERALRHLHRTMDDDEPVKAHRRP